MNQANDNSETLSQVLIYLFLNMFWNLALHAVRRGFDSSCGVDVNPTIFSMHSKAVAHIVCLLYSFFTLLRFCVLISNTVISRTAHFHHVIELLRFRQGTLSGIFLSAGENCCCWWCIINYRAPHCHCESFCVTVWLEETVAGRSWWWTVFCLVYISVSVLLHSSVWGLHRLYLHQNRWGGFTSYRIHGCSVSVLWSHF